jgi:2-oxo-3-hexenedioate decarboxylase
LPPDYQQAREFGTNRMGGHRLRPDYHAVVGGPVDRRERVAAIAGLLIDAYDQSVTIEQVTTTEPWFDVASAYEVLQHIAAERRTRGWVSVGRKIGFTNTTIWQKYGVSGPMWAEVWDRTVRFAEGGNDSVALASFVQPRIEPEVVFGLLAPPPLTEDAKDLLSCVEWMAPGFEIVQCHFPDWRFTAADCTAAFGLHGTLVVGRRTALTDQTRAVIARTLPTFETRLSVGGSVVDQGIGANVLGSPALALGYLARTVAEQSRSAPLAPGEIITTGTLTDAWPIRSGETWESDYGSLGLDGLTVTFL